MGVAAEAELDPQMTRYKDPDEPTTKVNFRVPISTEQLVFATMRLWRTIAQARGKSPKNVNFTHVASELLGDGAELEFTEYGGLPKDEEGWRQLREQIFATHGKSVVPEFVSTASEATEPDSPDPSKPHRKLRSIKK